MCELMGMSFAKPIRADFSIREFARRGIDNADGWGLAWYPDRAAALVKEAAQWHASPYSNFLQTYADLRSTVYLAHVRHRTVGGAPTYADTHPFIRELGGRDYCFAHNGTVVDIFKRPLGRFLPLGATDSEHLFCWLLDRVAGHNRHLETTADWSWLHQQLARANQGGKLNCLMSDGQRLFCYFDQHAHKGLTLRRVQLYDETRSFGDPDMGIAVGASLFNSGVVVASNPLSSGGWDSFKPGELIVLEKGEVTFSSHRSTSETQAAGIGA